MKNLFKLINNLIKNLLDYLFLRGKFSLNSIDIYYLIVNSDNILEVQTHNWNKKYIDALKINDAENILCTVCNVTISKALYRNKEESITCEEQQIKNLLE